MKHKSSMGFFLDHKLKKVKNIFDCQSRNLAREGLAFFPIAKNARLLNQLIKIIIII